METHRIRKEDLVSAPATTTGRRDIDTSEHGYIIPSGASKLLLMKPTPTYSASIKVSHTSFIHGQHHSDIAHHNITPSYEPTNRPVIPTPTHYGCVASQRCKHIQQIQLEHIPHIIHTYTGVRP
jgi:hypothetical protein